MAKAKARAKSANRPAQRTRSNRKKPLTVSKLRSYKIFSPFTLLAVVVVVVLSVIISLYQTGGDESSHALALNTVTGSRAGLTGYAALSNSNLTASNRPRLESVTVSGSSAVITGNGLTPGSTLAVGGSKTTTQLLNANPDGTFTLAAPINTQNCLLRRVPLFQKLCESVGSGTASVSMTVNGQTTNSLNINLSKATAAGSAAGQGALGSLPRTSGGSSGQICTPTICTGSQGTSQSCVGDSYNGSNGMFPRYPNGTGGLKWVHPAAGDVWNYGSPFTFEWQNPGSSLGNKGGGDLNQKTAFAQIALVGGCMHYNVQHYLDGDSDGAAQAAAADTDHDAKWQCAGGGSGCAWVENENGAPGCGTSNDGTDPKSCDTDDNFRAWSTGTDTADQDGASNHMLCVGIMKSGGRYNISNLDTPGADIQLTISSCVFGRPPSGTYKADLQVFGVSGPKGCSPGYRCSGLPDRVGGSSGMWEAVSDPFQLN